MLLAALCIAVLTVSAATVALLSRHAPARRSEQTYTVQRRPFASTISVAGTVVPLGSIDVVAPFDGVVRQVGFDYGRQIAAGQVLLVMDPFEVQQRARDARSTFLKASLAEAEMANWANGLEVARARRAVTTAESALKRTDRKMLETKSLLDRGLVPRSEYDGLTEQREAEALSLTAAQEDLAASLKKGLGPGRESVEIDLQNAKARLADINVQFARATVTAPAAGIIVRPPAAKSDSGGDLPHAGVHLSRGQLVGVITPTGSLAVSVKLDEADANRVREGQVVAVTGPGFAGMTLPGHVTAVAVEASQGEPSAAGASFAATISLDALSAEQARAVRIGMSANATITIYETASAIIVPPQAVVGTGSAATVNVRDPRTGHSHPTPIVVGVIAPNEVEVRSGLKPGDVVTWADQATISTSNIPTP